MSPAVRTASRAVSLLVRDLQTSLSCVSNAVLVPQRLAKTGPVVVTIPGLSARTKTKYGPWLSIAMELEPRQDDASSGTWRTHTLRYGYTLFGSENDPDEWLAYHYHPQTGVAAPHLHINADASWARKGLRKKHLPTGRVALEDVIKVVVEEFGARPTRSDWRKKLDVNRRMFDQRRNW